MFKNKTFGWAITGSFCTIPEVYEKIEEVVAENANVMPIISEKVANTDTRVGPSSKIIKKLEEITGNDVIKNMNNAEPIGPKKMFDLLIIAPCTGSSIARLNCGITDSSVLMAAKAHLRNNRPVVIGVSTNDGLSTNARNIGDLLNKKNIYFVPFGQDDPKGKPNSLKFDNEKITDTIYRFTCKSPEIVKEAVAGQFINVQVSDSPITPMLKRPISIHNIDKKNKTIEFIFQVRGKGTEMLAAKKKGEKLCILGPLGSGFVLWDFKNVAIVGGGIGIFPLYELAKAAGEDGGKVTTYLGFRDKNAVILEDEFKEVSDNLIIATDNGTYGEKGYVTDYLLKDLAAQKDGIEKFDAIFACGPKPMLSVIKKMASDYDIYCEVSLEERMGCAIGACMGCSVRLETEDGSVQYARVCKDGPVFDATTVLL